MTILILAGEDDEHAAHILRYLQTHGAEAEFLDSRHFPADVIIACDPVARTGSIRLPGGKRLAFDQIDSIYWRCYNGIGYPDLPDPEQAYIAQNDARSLFESFLIGLPARWVNGWQAFQLHQTKPVQFALVAALGIPVPDTLLTNDPEAVRQFVAGHPHSIFKPVQGGAHTRPVAQRHLSDENLKNLAVAPVTIQEEVPGTNIRVFVAGTRIMACEINTADLDYRDDPDPRIEVVSLPSEVESQCAQVARALQLVWTGIDLRRTPEGRFVFLEANPSPMFLGFESRTGLPLTESLAALLLGP
jgi:glutathione synthase/RimK-type ligase-like ATP-grasp enzyme